MPAAGPPRRRALPAKITIISSGDDFAADLATIKQSLSVKARATRREADNLRQIVRKVEARKAELDRTLALGRSPAVETELAGVVAEIESLSQKVSNT